MGWKSLFGKQKATQELASLPSPDMQDLKVVIRTDLGNIRTNNEDAALFFRVADAGITQEKGSILMVADGMGGHAAGEVASRMATDIISQEYFKQNGSDIEKALVKVFTMANKSIFSAATADSSKKGMGTTCTALVVTGAQVYYAHVGDSRAYAVKDKQVKRITTDHTYVQELIRSGTISLQEAETHPQRNILTNAMGTKPSMPVDTGKCDFLFEDNDKLMICSDGLYEYLADQEIETLLNNHSLQDAAEEMIQLAKQRGGHDNITVVLAEKAAAGPAPITKQTRDVILPVTKEIDLP